MATEGSHGPANASEYIVHHLGHLNTSGHPQKAIVDFSIINIYTVFWSVAMALLTAFLLRRAAVRVTSDVPNRFVGRTFILPGQAARDRAIADMNTAVAANRAQEETIGRLRATAAADDKLLAEMADDWDSWERHPAGLRRRIGCGESAAKSARSARRTCWARNRWSSRVSRG